MATGMSKPSDYDLNEISNVKGLKFAIIVSEWNSYITNNLLKGAYETLIKHDAIKENITIHYVPGCFELPIGAKMVLSSNTEINTVICLGCVIQGETKHFNYICEATSQGIKDVSLEFNTPVIFGVLTDNNKQQSINRSGGNYGNKGVEAAISAIKMANFKKHYLNNEIKI